jgi:hypothetical protein
MFFPAGAPRDVDPINAANAAKVAIAESTNSSISQKPDSDRGCTASVKEFGKRIDEVCVTQAERDTVSPCWRSAHQSTSRINAACC